MTISQLTAPHVLLADVAGALAAEGDIVRKAMHVLDLTTRATGASECSLWLGTAGGLVVAARAGSTVTTAADLAPYLEAGDVDAGPIAVRRLAAGGRRIGALVLRVEGGVTSDVATALTGVSQMLAPALAWAEQSRTFIAEAERRTRQLDEERRLLNHVVDALPASIYVVDRDYRITVWNRTREGGSQGVRREQALGKTLFEILHRAPAEKLRKDLDEVFRTGRIQQFTMETRANGEARSYRITKIPIQAVEGTPHSHVITIGEDVTDLAARQELLERSEQLAALGQLAAGIVHEVRAPLADVEDSVATLRQVLSDLARSGATVPDHGDEAAHVAADQAARCRAMLGIVADFSNASTGASGQVSVEALLGKARDVVSAMQGFAGLTVRVVVDAGLPRVAGNAEQLAQVLMALLRNAADAMADGPGTITLLGRSGDDAGRGVVIEVIDEGRGIDRADLPRIFEPFYTTKGPGRGTGLGLTICHSIITRHGGRIEVDSAVGAGSTFRILLPGAPSHD